MKRCGFRLIEVETQSLVIDTAYQRDVTGAGRVAWLTEAILDELKAGAP